MIPKIKSSFFNKYNAKSELHITQKPNEAKEVVRLLLKKDNITIVAVGGDGTVHETINGFIEGGKNLNESCELAVIECGTGGDLSKSLQLPGSLEKQLSLIIQPGYQLLDLGCIEYMSQEGEKKMRYFLNESQVGIGGAVVKKVGDAHKYLGGKFAFGSVSLNHAILYKPRNISFKPDQEKMLTRSLFGIVVANGTHCGGGMKLSPQAIMDDGMFDVILIEKMDLLNRIRSFVKIYSGNHMKSPYFGFLRAKEIEIDAQEKLYLEADGELLGTTPCKISILPATLRVKCNIGIVNY